MLSIDIFRLMFYTVRNKTERTAEMFEITPLHNKLIKQIKKYPKGISTDLLLKKNKNNNGVQFLLRELKQENYVTQLISEDDKLRQVMELDISEYTGDWVVTDKAMAYITNKKLEKKLIIFNRFIGFLTGVISTILIEILLSFIKRKIS